MNKTRLRTDFILLMGMLSAFICNLFSGPWHPIHTPESYMWIGVILFWLYSLRKEIADEKAKQLLYAVGWLLVMLFVLRIIKYDNTFSRPEMGRLLWYAYYIPICVIPLLSFILCMRLKRHEGKRKREIRFLSAICVCLVLLMLTNDIHGGSIRVYYIDGVEHSDAGIIYCLVLIWSFGMMLFSFMIMMTECRLMQARMHWWIPAAVCVFGMGLLAVYYANGGSSPKVFGINLYKFQEIILILYLGFWESCILIGLVPTVSMLRERNWIGEGIHSVISGQVDRIRNVSGFLWEKNEKDFCEGLLDMATLGVYIKRRANLELISDEQVKLSTKELSLAIRESMEYYSMKGMSVCLEETVKL